MKKIVLVGISAALIVTGINAFLIKGAGSPASQVANTQELQPINTIVGEPVIIEEEQVVVQEQIQPVEVNTVAEVVLPEPASDEQFKALFTKYGYDKHGYSFVQQLVYKLAKQYPERFTKDNIYQSVEHIYNTLSPLPKDQYTQAYLNFTW